MTGDIATCMYYTGIDPFTKKEDYVAKGTKDRKMQRALMQFFKPENYFTVREALIQAGRADLIGGCERLIPANPPKEAIEARRRHANRAIQGDDDDDHYHTVANPAKEVRPGRVEPDRSSPSVTGRAESRSSGGRGRRKEAAHTRGRSGRFCPTG